MKTKNKISSIHKIVLLALFFAAFGAGNLPSARAQETVRTLTSAPTVTGVSEASAPNDLDTPIVISGTGFITLPTVALNSTPLADVTWTSDTQLTATVPWGLIPGVYTLTVTNPDGGIGSLASAFTVTKGIGVWTSGGPYGGDIWNVVVNPLSPTLPTQVLATAKGSGLFASEDNAAQWRTAYIWAILERPAIDAQNPQIIYLGIGGRSVRSDDGGKNWQLFPRIRNCLDRMRPFTHPTISGTVYFAVACSDADNGGGLYKSTDWGATRVAITTGLTDTNVTTLAFYPGDPTFMIAGTRSGNVFTSHNGGDTWSFAAHVTDHIERLAINPSGAHEVWAVYSGSYPYSDGTPPYVFKSTNADLTTWEGVNVSTQNSTVWSVTFHPTISGKIYAGSDTGYVSINGGATWAPLGSGLPIGGGISGFEAGVKEISVDPQQTNRLYAATQQGVYQSLDSGTTWFKSDEKLSGVLPKDLVVSPFDPQTVYASTIGADVIRTNNGGQTWQKVTIPWVGNMSNLATDPFTDLRLYVGGNYDASLFISADGGTTYHTVTLPIPSIYTGWALTVTRIAPDPYHAGHLLTGVSFGPDEGGFYSSDDYGEHWQWVEVGHTIRRISSLVYDPNEPLIVYAGTDGGELLKSSDGGATWQILSGWIGTQTISAITINPDNSQEVFISSTDVDYHRIWISTDGGLTWTLTNQQPTTSPVWALSFAKTKPATLYAGTNSDGLWRSVNSGQTWTVANGLDQGSVFSLATTTDGKRVFVYVGISGGAINNSATGSSIVAKAISDTTLLGSGVYRYVQPIYKLFLPLLMR